jgi:anaerobic selenocysteine-containing dehydrogenase
MERIFAELAAEPAGQLKLIGKRDSYMINSWYSNLPKLKRNERDRNYLFMHPADAAARGVGEGDPVRIRSRDGAIEAPVRLSDALMAGVVAMTHGWGHGATPGMRFAQQHRGGQLQCAAALRARRVRADQQPGAHDRHRGRDRGARNAFGAQGAAATG